MFSNQIRPAFAARGIVLPLKCRCPFHRPYSMRCWQAYALCAIPVLGDRSKCSCGFWGFRPSNRKKYTRLFFYHGLSHRAHRLFLPFRQATITLQEQLPALPVPCPSQCLCGVLCFFRNGLLIPSVVLPVRWRRVCSLCFSCASRF